MRSATPVVSLSKASLYSLSISTRSSLVQNFLGAPQSLGPQFSCLILQFMLFTSILDIRYTDTYIKISYVRYILLGYPILQKYKYFHAFYRRMTKCCDMRGYLSFLVLRLIKKKTMSGKELTEELAKRKGTKPSPGTIYPVLKELVKNKWIEEVDTEGREKSYQLTAQGKKEVKQATLKFVSIFGDMFDEFKR